MFVEIGLRGGFAHSSDGAIAAYLEDIRRQQERGLDELLEDVAGGPAAEALQYLKPGKHLVKGSPRREISTLAARLGADVVVLGTVARTGVPGLFMGNTAETILSQLQCSVLAIKPPGFVTPVDAPPNRE